MTTDANSTSCLQKGLSALPRQQPCGLCRAGMLQRENSQLPYRQPACSLVRVNPRTERSMVRVALAFFLLLVSLHAAAQQRGLGLYAGIGVGKFQFEEDHGPLSVVLDDRRVDEFVGDVTQTIGIRSVRLEDSELSWKIFGGWNITGNLGVEVSYGRANELTSTFTEQFGGRNRLSKPFHEYRHRNGESDGLPSISRGRVFRGASATSVRKTSSTQNVGLVVSGVGSVQNAVNLGGSATDSGATAIVGFQWALPTFVLRADYELLDMNAGSAATLSAGVSLRF